MRRVRSAAPLITTTLGGRNLLAWYRFSSGSQRLIRDRSIAPHHPPVAMDDLKERLAPALPDEHDHRGGQERAHHAVEDTQGALGAQDALEDRAEGEPGEAAGSAAATKTSPNARD